MFLTAPRSYAAVVFHLGQREQLLCYGKLATSSIRGTARVFAIDPESKLLLHAQVGERSLTMVQAVLHQITQLLAPGCVPLFLSDGYVHYLTAIVTHCGHWVQTPSAPGHRASAQATLDASARAALCAGHQNDAALAHGTRQSPFSV